MLCIQRYVVRRRIRVLLQFAYTLQTISEMDLDAVNPIDS